MTSTEEQPTPAPHRRRKGSALDLVRSLGLVAIVVVAMALVSRSGEPSHPPVTVDVAATVQAARASATFPVIAAIELPSGWYANSAFFTAVADEPAHWSFHVGYSDGRQHYLGVVATTASNPRSVIGGERYVDAVGSRVIAGITFRAYVDAGTEVWLHRATAAEPYTILIGGTGSAQQSRLLAALRSNGVVATG